MLQANTRSLTLTTVFLASFNAITPVGTLKGDSVWYSPISQHADSVQNLPRRQLRNPDFPMELHARHIPAVAEEQADCDGPLSKRHTGVRNRSARANGEIRPARLAPVRHRPFVWNFESVRAPAMPAAPAIRPEV